MPEGPLTASLGPALFVAAWCAPSYLLCLRRGRDPLREHGLAPRPRRLGEMALIFAALPLFALVLWGLGRPFAETEPGALAAHLALQLALVALPEEYFFRGVLQPSLSRAWGGWLGGLAATALFALAHLSHGLSPARLLTFFPGLVFAWMRHRSGSIVPGALFHAACNGVARLIPLI